MLLLSGKLQLLLRSHGTGCTPDAAFPFTSTSRTQGTIMSCTQNGDAMDYPLPEVIIQILLAFRDQIDLTSGVWREVDALVMLDFGKESSSYYFLRSCASITSTPLFPSTHFDSPLFLWVPLQFRRTCLLFFVVRLSRVSICPFSWVVLYDAAQAYLSTEILVHRVYF